ncbi:hypothetical protein BKA93DRAFT_820336 [Sparassis latifolia]
MERTWTADDIQEWAKRRDEYREKKNMRPLAALRFSTNPEDLKAYQSALDMEKTILVKRLEAYATRTVAWDLGKHPLVQHYAPFSGVLFLPLNYRQSHGATKRRFSEGDDLNRIVYDFYNEQVPSSYAGVNYISQDGLRVRRHEYLGPMPYVVGYQFSETRGEASIEWWDGYLHAKWINNGAWRNEVYFDKNVEGWVSKLRGDYSRNLDCLEYTGLDP